MKMKSNRLKFRIFQAVVFHLTELTHSTKKKRTSPFSFPTSSVLLADTLDSLKLLLDCQKLQ